MQKEIFEKIVADSINGITPQFRKEIDNVNFFVEFWPSQEQTQKLNLRKGHTLFGLYEGVPLTKRSGNYHSVLPDRITIFMMPIIRTSRTWDEVIQKVKDTVWHEIGHYFGMNEMEVRRAEAKRALKQSGIVSDSN